MTAFPVGTINSCPICFNPSMTRSIYCQVCANLVLHQREGRARVACLKRARRPDGFHCEYCGALLNLTDPNDPFYPNFDHRTPGILNDLNVCAAIINVSKSNLTWLEFPIVVHATVDWWDRGVPFRKDVVSFSAWNATSVIKATNTRLVDMALQPRVLDAGVRLTFGPGKLCWVCERYPVLGAGKYCARCLRLVKRTTGASQFEQAAALKMAYSWEHDTFICYHLGVPLDLFDWTSPFYLWYDHLVPRKNGTLVVSSALANRMKTDTDLDEWHAYFRMLDVAMRGGTFEREKLQFKYWRRTR